MIKGDVIKGVHQRQGFAVDNEEFMEGMVAVSVPVRDSNDRYIASVAFHGPVQRISVDDAIKQVEKVQAAAQKLSQALFGQKDEGD